MRFHKKGSLELSVNAIVIIILAIALLGLGLMFIRNFLGAGSNKLSDIMGNVEVENPASSIVPITVSDISLKIGDTKSVKVPIGFYCESPSGCTDAKPKLVCDSGKIFDSAAKITVPAHGNVGYDALITTGSATSASSEVCTITVDQDGTATDWTKSKQIVVTIA